MEYKSLDIYDDMPSSMKRYISNYGWHFNRKAYEYATKFMKRLDASTNMKVKVVPYTKQEVDNIINSLSFYTQEQSDNKYVTKTSLKTTLNDYVTIAMLGGDDIEG